MPSPDEIKKRIPVWVAMSELFLDRDLTEAECQQIARTLAGSGYSLSELENILAFEVAAVCGPNLGSPAGEWGGFDETWLVERLTPLCGKQGGWFRSGIGSPPVRETWNRVCGKFQELRRGER